jgi:heavy metal response regulator
LRILVIEDERRLAHYIKKGLEENHFSVDCAYDGEEGLFMAETNDYDLIVLDLILPKKLGMDMLKEMRANGSTVPVLILSVKDSTQTKAEGLNIGADDYLTKPFSFIELLARIRAILRRGRPEQQSTLMVRDLMMDLVVHRVTRRGDIIELTSKEFALLEFFMRYPGQVLTRTMLIEHVWDYNFDCMTNIVDVFVNRIRNKIDKGYDEKLIHTIRGVGYVMREMENV